jgi:hypothetical protein
MRTETLTLSIFVGVAVAMLCSATAARGAEPDWKAVEHFWGVDLPATLAQGGEGRTRSDEQSEVTR